MGAAQCVRILNSCDDDMVELELAVLHANTVADVTSSISDTEIHVCVNGGILQEIELDRSICDSSSVVVIFDKKRRCLRFTFGLARRLLGTLSSHVDGRGVDAQ